MSAPWPHRHVSERERDGSWEDCLWASATEWLNDTWKTSAPDTLAWAEKLRAASGEPPTGGSNFGDLQRGLNKMGIPVTVTPLKRDAFLTALKPDYAGMVSGSMGNFASSHRLRRWQRSFAGGHMVYVARLADGSLWWCDPLAPEGTYQGEKISTTELRTFMGTGWTGVARPILPEPIKETDMIPLRTYLPGYTASVKASSNIRVEPVIKATKLHTTSAKLPVLVIGTVIGDVDPANGKNVWYELWHDNRREYTALDNIVDLKAPVAAVATPDDGFTKATQDAAVSRASADARADEKERIALAVGTSAADGIRKI